MPKSVGGDDQGLNPFGELIGLKFTAYGQGRSRCQLQVRKNLLNPHGVLHGGVIYSMADTGMGGALYSILEEKELCATVEIKMTYFEAVKSGKLTCDTQVINRLSRMATLESEIKNQGRIVAKATGTFYIYEKK